MKKQPNNVVQEETGSGEQLKGDDGIGIECVEDTPYGSQAVQADTIGTRGAQKQASVEGEEGKDGMG